MLIPKISNKSNKKEIPIYHKVEYLILILSFLPWIILSIMTFGILLIIVLPYIYVTLVHYYEYLKTSKTPKTLLEEDIDKIISSKMPNLEDGFTGDLKDVVDAIDDKLDDVAETIDKGLDKVSNKVSDVAKDISKKKKPASKKKTTKKKTTTKKSTTKKNTKK